MALNLLQNRIPTLPDPLFDDPTIDDSHIDYPREDDEPMGETGLHARAIMYLYHALSVLFPDSSTRYIAADMFFYCQKGNLRASKVPDVMLIKGIDGTYERGSFKTWVEGAMPQFIAEISSRSTWTEDPFTKKDLYEQLGVHEYFIFDPQQEFLDVPLMGFRLMDGRYEPLPMRNNRIFSEQLGTTLYYEGEVLRVVDPLTARYIPWGIEIQRQVEQALKRMREAMQQAREASRRADEEAQRANEEAQRARREFMRATEAEAENVRLRLLIEQLRRQADKD